MKADYKKYILDFKRPSGTSRGILHEKETWFLILREEERSGVGECGLLKGLSLDDVPEYEEKLKWVCANIDKGEEQLLKELMQFPSIQFGVEQAFRSFRSPSPYLLFDSDFTRGNTAIPINGLIWMGEVDFMKRQIDEKIRSGYDCLKLKIGAIDFESELKLLESLRKEFPKELIELRVDANGAFSSKEALKKLEALSSLDLHSIEQPIKQGQWKEMATICLESPIPVALDEELIGIINVTKKEELLLTLNPQYLILKPSLQGGISGCMEWIRLARKYGIGWWVTSALESNIGLNAIAQWTFTLGNNMHQGLGTGGLYTNNFRSPLTIEKGHLRYRPENKWKTNLIQELCT